MFLQLMFCGIEQSHVQVKVYFNVHYFMVLHWPICLTCFQSMNQFVLSGSLALNFSKVQEKCRVGQLLVFMLRAGGTVNLKDLRTTQSIDIFNCQLKKKKKKTF